MRIMAGRIMAAIAFSIPVLLGGCAGSGEWAKQGATPERVDRDQAACEREARQATRREENIDSDILASRGNDWLHSGTLSEQRLNMEADEDRAHDRVMARCMAEKGYSPTGKN